MRDEDDRPAPLPQAADDLVETRRSRSPRGSPTARRGRSGPPRARARAGSPPAVVGPATGSRRSSPLAGRSRPPRSDRSNRSRSDPRSMKPARRGSTPRNTFWATVSRGTSATSWATSAIPRTSASRGEPNVTVVPRSDQVALILREDAGDDLAQRGLAGAVLADERVDRAGPDGDRDIVESARRPEGLAERAHLEMDGRVRRAGHGVSRSRSASARPLREREEGIHVGLRSRRHRPAASRADRHRAPACRTGWHRSGPSCPGRLRSRASA